MIKLDENLLVELGLAALPKDEKTSFLKHMYETLEMRVGTRLAERMSDQQMGEFEQFIKGNDEQGAFHWLENNFPNYKEVVAEEFEVLKNEIKPIAADILAANQISSEAVAYTQEPQAPQEPQAFQQPQAPQQPQALQTPQTFQPFQGQQPQPSQTPPQQYPPQPPQPQAPGHHPQYPQQ